MNPFDAMAIMTKGTVGCRLFKTGITADTALRLGKALGTSAQLWMNLQNRYDVEVAKARDWQEARQDRAGHRPRSGLNLNLGLAI